LYDGLLGCDRQESARLDARDLAVLGRYLFGARWKAALARELAVSDRIVKYWASAQRPTSVRCSVMILALVQRRHDGRLAVVQQGYAAMLEALRLPVRAHYERLGLVAIAAALRAHPGSVLALGYGLTELAKLVV
jgi:hypothetical protein